MCHALCIFHNASLVHRDIRLANIVRLSKTEFVLINLKSVADSPFILLEGFRHFSGWNLKMFEGNQYTPFSDMYSLGELLNAELSYERTSLAENFVRKLTNKQLSASDALQDPWLSVHHYTNCQGSYTGVTPSSGMHACTFSCICNCTGTPSHLFFKGVTPV